MRIFPRPAESTDSTAPRAVAPPAPEAGDPSHALQLQQLELQAQNEELHRIRAELEAQRAKLIERYDAWLGESEARFRRFTELSADWYWETDAQGLYTLLSGRAGLEPAFDVRGALGGDRRDLAQRLGARFDQLAPAPDEFERLLADRRGLRDSLSKWTFGDASERFFRSSFEPMVDALGKFIGWRGVTRDVTEFERVAAALARTTQRFELALGAANTFVIDLDLGSARLTLHGAPRFGGPGSVVELPIGDVLSNVFPDDAQALLGLIEQVRSGALTSVDFEYRVGWPDASHWTWRRLQAKVVASDAQAGRAQRLSGTSTDIGERKRAEMQLRDREERLRLSELRYRLAAASGQLWDWDIASGRFNVAAESWRRLGLEPPPPGEEIARYEQLIHPDDRATQRAALREHLARRTPYAMEFRVRDSAGQWRRFHTQGQATWDATGRATCMAGTTIEIQTR
jgi:PAS domain-containing protein